jgi:hypothetical protein
MPAPVTHETVREQLLALGYTDIPDDILDEFVDELNASPLPSLPRSSTATAPTDTVKAPLTNSTFPHSSSSSSKAFQSSNYTSSTPRNKGKQPADPYHPTLPSSPTHTFTTKPGRPTKQQTTIITKEDVKLQLETLGYGSMEVPDEIIEELTQELNETFVKESSVHYYHQRKFQFDNANS